jgi:hypothetical protein
MRLEKSHNEVFHNFAVFAKYNWNVQVKEVEMDRACSTNGGEEECIQGFVGKARRKEITKKTYTWVERSYQDGP